MQNIISLTHTHILTHAHTHTHTRTHTNTHARTDQISCYLSAHPKNTFWQSRANKANNNKKKNAFPPQFMKCVLPLSVVCEGHTHRKQYRKLKTDNSSSESLESSFPTRLLTTNTHTQECMYEHNSIKTLSLSVCVSEFVSVCVCVCVCE